MWNIKVERLLFSSLWCFNWIWNLSRSKIFKLKESAKIISSAITMSKSYERSVGIIKLVGCNTGFVCMQAALCSGEVNVCLIPEF